MLVKRNYLLFLLSFFTAQFTTAQTPLYVWAKNGLTLRAEPYKSGRKMATLPYGTAVQILGHHALDSVVVIPAFKRTEQPFQPAVYMRANWVRAKCGRDTGYLFSGYLSDMQPFMQKKNQTYDYGGPLNIWVEQQGRILDRKPRWPNSGDDDSTTVYASHIVRIVHTGEGGGSVRYIFPAGRTFNDGLLLLNYFNEFDFTRQELETCESLEMRVRENYIWFETVGLAGRIYWRFMINFDGETLILEQAAGC